MRTPSGKGILQKVIWSLIALSLVSCGGAKGVSYKSKKRPIEITQHAPVSKEIIRPSERQSDAVDTPERHASDELIEKGKVYFGNGEYERSEDVFQDAIDMDGSNGLAYFYLAKSRYILGKYGEALGVLDKAESLLAGSPKWVETITKLREMIQEKLSAE